MLLLLLVVSIVSVLVGCGKMIIVALSVAFLVVIDGFVVGVVVGVTTVIFFF